MATSRAPASNSFTDCSSRRMGSEMRAEMRKFRKAIKKAENSSMDRPNRKM